MFLLNLSDTSRERVTIYLKIHLRLSICKLDSGKSYLETLQSIGKDEWLGEVEVRLGFISARVDED